MYLKVQSKSIKKELDISDYQYEYMTFYIFMCFCLTYNSIKGSEKETSLAQCKKKSLGKGKQIIVSGGEEKKNSKCKIYWIRIFSVI